MLSFKSKLGRLAVLSGVDVSYAYPLLSVDYKIAASAWKIFFRRVLEA